MSSATTAAEEHRQFPISFTVRNLPLPIPRPIARAASIFVARLRRIDEAMALDYNAYAQPARGAAVGPQHQEFQQMPVPWTFLTSGYFIGFLVFVRFTTLDHWQA